MSVTWEQLVGQKLLPTKIDKWMEDILSKIDQSDKLSLFLTKLPWGKKNLESYLTNSLEHFNKIKNNTKELFFIKLYTIWDE